MTTMLAQFRVTDFRSVKDSGPIEVDNVTSLIGTNESGKTNLLLPLWKLNPAKEGAIDLTDDYPRKHFAELRKADPQPDFIDAVFLLDAKLVERLSTLTGANAEVLREVRVIRDFAGEYAIDFPNASTPNRVSPRQIRQLIDQAIQQLGTLVGLKKEGDFKDRAIAAAKDALDMVPDAEGGDIDDGLLEAIINRIVATKAEEVAPKSSIEPRLALLTRELESLRNALKAPLPAEVDGVFDIILESLPKFVYYSNYGNLDSEIYLPHVIQNLKRNDLGAKEAAKARTLKVLFEFVGLSPEEILELGRDFRVDRHNRQPTLEEIEEIAEKKRQRSILLQSASSLLTERFRDWWKQGEYRFRFEADGDHFRIWVSDDKRAEEIELEQRSTGLQWFLSFYLVFLVESRDAHARSILLLDEPGLSLHPLAQRDLSKFFEGLSATNQLLYTTHSPFLVDADHLDRVRRVYVAADGSTKASAELRSLDSDAGQRGSGYAVHAALNLTVAESLLLGCEPVIVEGPSDQHYLTGIKGLLIASGRLKIGRELVFPPAGGAKGVRPIAALLLGRDEALPVALLDSDETGRAFANSLRTGLYRDAKERVLEIGNFLKMADAEIEDLIPEALFVREVDRFFRSANDQFVDVFSAGSPVVPQVEKWVVSQGLNPDASWKVEISKRVKRALLSGGINAVSAPTMDLWTSIFAAFAVPELA